MANETYPYPLRASELVKDFPVEILQEKISLTKEEKLQILQFEGPLALKLKEVKAPSIEDHVIYPEAFTTEQGSRIFAAIYVDPNLSKKIDKYAKEHGVDLETEKDKRKFYNNFFDNLVVITSSEDKFKEYNAGYEMTPRLGKVDEKDIERLFNEADLRGIPSHLGDRINVYSSSWAEEQFISSFIDTNGDVNKIQNPRRLRRLVNPEVARQKLEGLRKFKLTLKEIRGYLVNDKGTVPEAKVQICNLYQKSLNVTIAELLSYQENPETPGRSRKMERIDHFLSGVGLEYSENGLLQTIPADLANYCQKRLSEVPTPETSDFTKYNSFTVNADQAKSLADVVLNSYGLLAEPNPWKAVVLDRNKGLAVMFDKKNGTREVRIPRDFNRGIVTTLALLAHEIEGHVIRYANKETSFKDDLLFTKDNGTGRSGILSEGSAMWLEDQAKQEMVGMEDKALPYYYVALMEKRRGGSFKECISASFKSRAEREYGMSAEDLLKDKEKSKKVLDKAYSATMRIFRRFTDFNDKSGYIPISETLDYIEQEIVVDFLMNHSKSETLTKLLFVAGIDLYSIEELIKIGFFDLSKVQAPKKVVVKEIWPKIKEALDSGQTIEEALKAVI